MRIAIIGCGSMGSSLAKCLSQFHSLFLYDCNNECLQKAEKEGCGKACLSFEEAIQNAELVILAVKPQNLKKVADQINSVLQPSQILLSVLAGTPLSTLKIFFSHACILRAMPNLAVRYGEGVIGISCEDQTDPILKQKITTILEPLGKIHWIEEESIDALTALTGSGPAFMFLLIEAMTEAGIAMGFSSKDAQALILQMIKGSISMLQVTQQHPGELKWQVASPGGTTIAGLIQMEELAVHGAIIRSFLTSYARTQQLNESQLSIT